MSTTTVCATLLLILCGCGDPAPEQPPEPFDGTVTFFIAPPEGSTRPGMLSKTTVTFLEDEKPGRTRFVDAWQEGTPEGARYGRHRFPAGTTAAAVADYYDVVLQVSGWKTPTDYTVADGSIHFFGATRLRAGADRGELQVGATP